MKNKSSTSPQENFLQKRISVHHHKLLTFHFFPSICGKKSKGIISLFYTFIENSRNDIVDYGDPEGFSPLFLVSWAISLEKQ